MLNLYYHGGSGNHGCEAIVRSTVKMFHQSARLFTAAPDEDFRYGLGKIAEVIEDRSDGIANHKWLRFVSAISHKLTGTDYTYIKLAHKQLMEYVNARDIWMSIGGDNYCYSGVDRLAYYNKMLHSKGAKTILWGCSIEPSALTADVIKDLKRYDLITVRESLSFEGLKRAGITKNVVLCADPAFQLDSAEIELPDGWSPGHMIGINASPLAVSCGKLVLDNYIELIRYILRETGDVILLIPHVVKKETDDRQTLLYLYERFRDEKRVRIVEDCSCTQLKGIISQCKLFVGARTHATIAAYSSCVPTLAVGYSIKARGIAKDIFGTEENYVIPVQNLKTPFDLREKYKDLNAHSEEIRRYLKNRIPDYKKKSLLPIELVKRLEK